MDKRTTKLVKAALKRHAVIYIRPIENDLGGITFSCQVERPRGRSWKVTTITHPVMENALRAAILESFYKSDS